MNDLISRQAAIHEIHKQVWLAETAKTFLTEALNELPSTDVVEVVRCKNCKNSEHWYRDRRRCFLWSESGIAVFEDGFCNYGERKDE